MKVRFLSLLAASLTLGFALTACGGDNDQGAFPPYKAGPPSTTPTSQPTTTPTTPGPTALATHSTYTYGGLKLIVNLPADIPSASRRSLGVFSEFLQADGRMTASNKFDPSVPRLAASHVVEEARASIETELSVHGIGSVIYTLKRIQSSRSGFTVITGCLDQSKLVQVRKDGSQYVDENTRKAPTLKMTANIDPRTDAGTKVTLFTFADGPC